MGFSQPVYVFYKDHNTKGTQQGSIVEGYECLTRQVWKSADGSHMLDSRQP